MSEKRVVFNIRIDEATKKELERLALEEGISVAAYTRESLEKTVKRKENIYKFLDESCPMVRYLAEEDAPKKKGEGFYCLKRSPKEDKLGRGTEKAAKNYCEVCQITKGLKDYETQKREGIKIEMPRCTKGGYPNEDMTELFCPDRGTFRPIIERKKKTDYKPCYRAGANDSNCPELKYITVIKGLKEKDNR